MEKFKICPACGAHNKPNMIECFECETDLTGVKVTDENAEAKEKLDVNKSSKNNEQDEYIRVCDCGFINPATARICKGCGEDISDIPPTVNVQSQKESSCKYILTSLDGTYSYEIKKSLVSVGRENEMQEYLADKTYVSRMHAEITSSGDKLYIKNLSKTNYTFVNNRKISVKTELKADDEIGLGGNNNNGKRQNLAAYFIVRNA